MDKKDFYDIEDQIMNTVKNAVNAIDFATLKNEFENKADDTLKDVKNKLKDYNKKIEDKRNSSLNKNKLALYIDKKPKGSISGILYILFGSIASIFFGVLLVMSLIVTSILSGFLTNGIIGTGIILLFFLCSIGFSIKGIRLRQRVNRFKEYVKYMDSKSYCLIEDLSKHIKEKNKFVVKDLRKMIDLGMFKQGHIDEEKTYFMINDEVYENYLNLKLQQESKKKLEKQKNDKEAYNPKDKELENIIKIGENYIREIKDIKNHLYKESFSLKLDKLQKVVSEILSYIQKNPRKLQEVDKFINYYLPITIKLINSYKELNSKTIQGENIRNAKHEIEKSIDIINNAFEKLLDDLYEDFALDISTDISVLKTLFKQEGLGKKDFEK